MLDAFNRWYTKRLLARSRHAEADWRHSARHLPLLDRLSESQLRRLIELATLFLSRKTLSGADDLQITDSMCRLIALQACLPILNLGLDWYDGWSSIIVYPGAFRRRGSEIDEFGIVHELQRDLSGEAWQRGPVILSWHDASQAGTLDGHNVVIHEFVHKLDMLNGPANGFPPLPSDMSAAVWSEQMNQAFEDFRSWPRPGLDRYAASDPAEFLAVMSEVFFETPELLRDAYPSIYQLLTQFFRQDPISRVQ